MSNPLQKFMRSEKFFIKLPSDGHYYADDLVTFSDSREVGILPMTAMDEILLNTPDALLNGEGIKKAVESCVPAVKDASKLVVADFEVLLLAIRKASHGDAMEFVSTCPKCEKENEYNASVQGMLDTVEQLDPPYSVDIEKGLTVFVKPYTFESVTLMALQSIETAKVIQAMNLGEDVDEADMLETLKAEYTKSITRIAKMAVETVTDGIDYVEIVADGVSTKVTDSAHIAEWLAAKDKAVVDAIQAKVANIPVGINKDIPVTCEHCKHEWEARVEINPTDFFALGS